MTEETAAADAPKSNETEETTTPAPQPATPYKASWNPNEVLALVIAGVLGLAMVAAGVYAEWPAQDVNRGLAAAFAAVAMIRGRSEGQTGARGLGALATILGLSEGAGVLSGGVF